MQNLYWRTRSSLYNIQLYRVLSVYHLSIVYHKDLFDKQYHYYWKTKYVNVIYTLSY